MDLCLLHVALCHRYKGIFHLSFWGEANDDAVNRCLVVAFAIPYECAPSKVNMNAEP